MNWINFLQDLYRLGIAPSLENGACKVQSPVMPSTAAPEGGVNSMMDKEMG